LLALKAIRDMAEVHTNTLIQRIKAENLVASDSPDDFIDLAWIDEFSAAAADLWVAGIDLATDAFGVRMGVALPPSSRLWRMVSDSIEESRSSYLDLIKALAQKHAYGGISEPVFGEFLRGDTVQYGDVRGLLVRLGGGSASPEVTLTGGITTGTHMSEWLADSGVNTNQKIWLYGWEEKPRRRTFNGHLQMDGLVFEEWDDDGLIIAPQDRWLRRNYYAPGDHWGCACVVAPYFPNFGEPFEI
jgi:hypothetical protein